MYSFSHEAHDRSGKKCGFSLSLTCYYFVYEKDFFHTTKNLLKLLRRVIILSQFCYSRIWLSSPMCNCSRIRLPRIIDYCPWNYASTRLYICNIIGRYLQKRQFGVILNHYRFLCLKYTEKSGFIKSVFLCRSMRK